MQQQPTQTKESNMTTFASWYENADMPTQAADGQWYDAETGLPYSSQKPRKAMTAKAIEARATAKFFGGKALTGSTAQKEWAEKIRAAALDKMTDGDAAVVCCKAGLLNTAKIWIENRDKTASQFAAFAVKQKQLLAAYKAAAAKQDSDSVKSISSEYNALTASFGL